MRAPRPAPAPALLATFTAAALTLAAPIAGAQPRAGASAADARRAYAVELHKEATAAYESGDYAIAAKKWKEAHDLTGDAALLYNLGNAHERLLDWAEAIRYLELYAAVAPMAERASIERRVMALRARTGETTSPAASPASPTPTVPAAGRPSSADRTAASTAPPPAADPPAPSDATNDAPTADPSALQWALAGVAGAGLVSGAVFGIVSASHSSDVDAACKDAGDRLLCPTSSKGASDAAATTALIADVSFGVSLAAATALLLSILLDDDDAESASEAAASLRLAPAAHRSGGGLTLRGRF